MSKNNYIVPTDEWRVIVTVDNEFRVLITVTKMNGIWKVVGIGATLLANELGAFEKKYPLSSQNGMILRILQLDSEFLLIPSDQFFTGFKVYFLASANIALDQSNDYQSSYSLQQVLLSIKNKIENK